jgi:hypothetical protein
MDNYYTEQLERLQFDRLPFPLVRFKDYNGYLSDWLHLTPECIGAIQKYLGRKRSISDKPDFENSIITDEHD